MNGYLTEFIEISDSLLSTWKMLDKMLDKFCKILAR